MSTDLPNRLSKIREIPRVLRPDDRGWFLKVIDGKEEDLPASTGEVYLVSGSPGAVRGNHYHVKASEWFTVVAGEAVLRLVDVDSRDEMQILMTASKPVTVFVPPGIAHGFMNSAQSGDMLLVAYTDTLYESGDTIPYVVHEAVRR